MRTQQELYDIVVAHLRKQHAKSQSPDKKICMYRGEGGLKCAVGVLIPDEIYNHAMEFSLHTLTFYKGDLLPDNLRLEFATHFDLLSTLQEVHDKVEIDNWEKKFKTTAKLLDLQYTPPETP